MTIQKPQHFNLQIIDDRVLANSLDVALRFGKRHDHVLRDIENMKTISESQIQESLNRLNADRTASGKLKTGGDRPKTGAISEVDQRKSAPISIFQGRSSAEIKAELEAHFSQNFIKSEALDERNRPQPIYLMTRSGFSVLVMGFRGAYPLVWKFRYEQAFREMEIELRKIRSKADGFIHRAERHLELFPEFKTTLGTTRRAMSVHAASLQIQIKGVIVPAPTSQQLTGMIKKQKLDGFKEANRWFVYEDSLCKWLATRADAA